MNSAIVTAGSRAIITPSELDNKWRRGARQVKIGIDKSRSNCYSHESWNINAVNCFFVEWNVVEKFVVCLEEERKEVKCRRWIKEKIKKKKKRYERDKFYRDFVNLLIIKRKVEQNVDYLW